MKMSENTYSYDEIYAQVRAAAQELLDEKEMRWLELSEKA